MNNVIPINLYSTHFVVSRLTGLLLTRDGQYTRYHFQAARVSKSRAERMAESIGDADPIPVDDWMLGGSC